MCYYINKNVLGRYESFNGMIKMNDSMSRWYMGYNDMNKWIWIWSIVTVCKQCIFIEFCRVYCEVWSCDITVVVKGQLYREKSGRMMIMLFMYSNTIYEMNNQYK